MATQAKLIDQAAASAEAPSRPALVSRAEWLTVLAASVALLGAAGLPYWLAWRGQGEAVFTGLLMNPVDGATYLAKLRAGWRGDWLFTLPYTAEPGPGALIYTYHLALGHLARLTGASIEGIYHLARNAGGLVMLLAAYDLIARLVPERRWRAVAWWIFAAGSGLGWAAAAAGAFTSDLWVAEGFPFLALFTNAHFGLAFGLVLLLVSAAAPGLASPRSRAGHVAWVLLLTTALAQVQPLALLSLALPLAGSWAWQLWADRGRVTTDVQPAVVCAAGALPWLAYLWWLSQAHPVLAGWSAQNQTPSPALWDALLAGGVPLLLALAGAAVAWRRRSAADRLLAAWLALGALALYIPFALQRRLALGLWLPVAVLAALALARWLPRLPARVRRAALAAVLAGVTLSNGLVLAATTAAALRRDPALFLTRAEDAGLSYLAEHTSRADVVLAPPNLALWVPARTDARVIYGHPFETVEAAERRAEVQAFYAGEVPPGEFVREHNVRYVVSASADANSWPWPVVFAQDGFLIYAP